MTGYDWHNEEDLVDLEDSVFRLSASKLKTYKTCPYQFYLSKVAGVETTDTDRGYLELGSAVHESIENVLGREKWQSPPRHQNQLRQDMIAEFRQWNPDVDEELWDRGMECLETCAKYMVGYLDDTSVMDLEPKFEYTLGRADVSAQFAGYIDMVTEDGDVVDWKTGSIREEDEVIQGAVYMRGYQELYGEPPNKIRFAYLKEGQERTLEPNDEKWDAMIEHAKQCIESVRHDLFTADPDESKCFWCSVSGYCHANPSGGGEIVDWVNYKRRQVAF